LRAHLKPVPLLTAQQLARLIADLDDNRFSTRERATRDLERLGESAASALRQGLKNPPSLEGRRRVGRLLVPIERAVYLRERRALEVLEQIGTLESRFFLAALARGAPGAWLTVEAERTGQRLAQRKNLQN